MVAPRWAGGPLIDRRSRSRSCPHGTAPTRGARTIFPPTCGSSGDANGDDGREVVRDHVPRPAVVLRAEHVARLGAEVQAQRIAAVVHERLAQDCEVSPFLRKAA